MMVTKYTETETEKFYDQEDSLYRSFWDAEGSLHWGFFENLTSASKDDFLPACNRWNQYMLQCSNINNQSKVLDLGCGNGNTAIWLAQETGCEVVGIDISQVRIDNARKKSKDYPNLNLSFEKASATNLPFAEGSFTHVWSQATLYHVHERTKALQEIHRVLKEGGTLIFDDLVTPRSEISENSHRYVYERLLFEPTFSQESYTETLSNLGLMVLEAKDLSLHLHKSYDLLSQLALPQYPDLNAAYIKMCKAIAQKELGWSFYLCEKVSDRLTWIYDTSDSQNLENKYDAWSHLYDSELDQSYRISPIESARTLAKVVSNKQATILDAGAGTGMVGEALAELGYNKITGVDISFRCDLSSLAEATPLTCSVNRSASIGYPWKEDNPSKRRGKNQGFNPKRNAYEMQSSNITYLRKARPWYQEIPYDVLQQFLRHLNKACNNFFTGRAKFPRFKKLGDVKHFEFKPKSVYRKLYSKCLRKMFIKHSVKTTGYPSLTVFSVYRVF
ncbi:MAG: methyltransferase domain-containing protein [Moorea sp. SIO2B7]|nr:methyltransferase domain-containing protein [Moorena sp. SIO2B7]